MNQELRIQILLEIFKDTMAHLRSSDDKRDRLFHVYITMMLAVVSGLLILRRLTAQTRLDPGSVDDFLLPIIVVLMLLLFGEITYLALVGARKWHAEYVNCAIILKTMITANTDKVDGELIPKQNRHSFLGSFYTNRQMMLVQIGILGTLFLVPGVVADGGPDARVYILIAITCVSTLFFNGLLAMRILRKAETSFWKDPRNNWVLSGLAFKEYKE